MDTWYIPFCCDVVCQNVEKTLICACKHSMMVGQTYESGKPSPQTQKKTENIRTIAHQHQSLLNYFMNQDLAQNRLVACFMLTYILQTTLHYPTWYDFVLGRGALHCITLHRWVEVHSVYVPSTIQLINTEIHTCVQKFYDELKSCKLSSHCTTLLLSPFVHLRQSARNSCTAASSTLAAQLRLAGGR